MTVRQPSPQEIREQLERILASACFSQTERHRRFLSLIVNETLAGNSDRLKGYAIALDVFDRTDDFDPQADPLVRVEAGRLRRRLTEYYAGEGIGDAVRIEVPRGTYEASFAYIASAPTVSPPAGAAGGRFSGRVIAGLTALAAIAALAAWFGSRSLPGGAGTTGERSGDTAANLPEWPRVFVTPFFDLSASQSFGYFAYGITEEITTRLRDFELLVIMSEAYPGNDAGAANTNRILEETGVLYALTGSVRRDDDDIRITARLIDTRTAAQLWTQVYDEDLGLSDLLDIQEDIARNVVRAIGEPYGPIYESEYARIASRPPKTLRTYDCVLKYFHYRREFEFESNQEVKACFLEATESEPLFVNAWAGLSLIEAEEYFFGPAILSGATGLLDSAEEHARRALDIDGNSYLAHVAMMRLRFMQRDIEGFERSAARVVELRPTDPFGLYTIAAYEAMLGHAERAGEIRRLLLELSPEPRRTMFITGELIALTEGDYQSALEEALRIDTPNWFVGPMLEALAAALAGRDEIAARSYRQMIALNPDILGKEEEFMRRLNVRGELLDTMLTGLELARTSGE